MSNRILGVGQVVLAAAFLVAALGAAAPAGAETFQGETRAPASPYTELVTSSTLVSSSTTGVAIAACPTGSVVVGGGYSGFPSVAVYSSSMEGNGWRAAAMNNDMTSRWLTVHAVCLHGLPGAVVEQVTDQRDIPPSTSGVVWVSCPDGSLVTDGGFHKDQGGDLALAMDSLVPPNVGWQLQALNSGATTRTLHVYAICLSGADGWTDWLFRGTHVVGPLNSKDSVAHCGPGVPATGGGFMGSNGLVVHVHQPLSTGAWQVNVVNPSPTESGVIESLALCLYVGDIIFSDGFENEHTVAWSSTTP